MSVIPLNGALKVLVRGLEVHPLALITGREGAASIARARPLLPRRGHGTRTLSRLCLHLRLECPREYSSNPAESWTYRHLAGGTLTTEIRRVNSLRSPPGSSAITEVSEELLRRLHVILQTLSSRYDVNLEKYDDYVEETLSFRRRIS